MKTILLLVLVLGFAILGSAQTAAPARVLANSIDQVREENVTHFSGHVQIVVGTVEIQADEVDVHHDTGEAELRGHVHMKGLNSSGRR
jgi:lipopolysaccharide export system protein LptA